MSQVTRWGGRRKGAGRKSESGEPRQTVSASLPKSLVETLDGVAKQDELPRSRLIERALSAWLTKENAVDG